LEIKIFCAKNGEETASCDGIFLHSSYSPVNEAKRFAQTLEIPFDAKTIVITEPALSYCTEYLKERFSEKKIGIIRYVPQFCDYNCKADFVINYFEHENNFDTELFNYFGEEELFCTFFASWKASEKVFEKINTAVWKSIKLAMQKAKTLLVTREFFEKKWLINSCNFAKYASGKNFVSFNSKIKKPVLICASGPSLKDSLKIIKDTRERFFIICLSSALSVLLYNKIIPDMCISTDGGWWAGNHLKPLINNPEIPLALPPEAFCKKSILKNQKIIPLTYSDGASNLISSNVPFVFINSERNGTVSGTALSFAETYSDFPVFFCGLDMANYKGKSHCKPNMNEILTLVTLNRLKNNETLLVKSSINEESLAIYREWFINHNCKNTTYRVICDAKNTLGNIKDILPAEFEKLIKNDLPKNNEAQKSVFLKERFADKENEFKLPAQKIFQDILQKLNDEEFYRHIFPLEYVAYINSGKSEENRVRLTKKIEELSKKIRKLADEN